MAKRKKIILRVFVITIIVLAVAGVVFYLYHFISFLCGGFNGIMRGYLGNAENYHVVNVNYECAVYYDKEIKGYEIYDGTQPADDVHFFAEVKSDEYFVSGEYDFRMPAASAAVLAENGFFDEVGDGCEITVRATGWIYWDNDFNFIASVTVNGKEYLGFDTGLENIIAYMNERKI